MITRRAAGRLPYALLQRCCGNITTRPRRVALTHIVTRGGHQPTALWCAVATNLSNMFAGYLCYWDDIVLLAPCQSALSDGSRNLERGVQGSGRSLASSPGSPSPRTILTYDL